MLKFPLILMICAPLLIAPLLQPALPATPAKAHAVNPYPAQSDSAQSDPSQSDSSQTDPAQTEDEEEKPFLLLASVHNYGYIEPCG